MNTVMPITILRNAILAATTALLLGGCSYDYLQHSDRVAYSAGNAVKANLEGQVIDPSSGHIYDVSGLGKNGQVIEPATGETATP